MKKKLYCIFRLFVFSLILLSTNLSISAEAMVSKAGVTLRLKDIPENSESESISEQENADRPSSGGIIKLPNTDELFWQSVLYSELGLVLVVWIYCLSKRYHKNDYYKK